VHIKCVEKVQICHVWFDAELLSVETTHSGNWPLKTLLVHLFLTADYDVYQNSWQIYVN